MPIYEYICHNCSHEFEQLQKISEEPLTKCPQCNQPDVKRLVSATSFRLKGSGWYETDFKNKTKKSSEGDKSVKSEDSNSSSSGSDTNSSKETKASPSNDAKNKKADS